MSTLITVVGKIKFVSMIFLESLDNNLKIFEFEQCFFTSDIIFNVTFSGLLQRRLDYFFIINNVKEFILDTEIKLDFSSDHSPIKEKQSQHKSRSWKFNNSSLFDNIFKEKLKQHIQNIKDDNDLSNNPLTKWEFLKYKICKFTVRFAKTHCKKKTKQG